MILDPSKKEDLEQIKSAIREDSDDDLGVKSAALAAVAYIKGAIGNKKPSFYQQDNDHIHKINLAIKLLTDHYYHAGSATVESQNANGTLREYDLGFTSIILQLKAAYLQFEEDDSDD
ncbi:head-tail connector protein [Enterococcus hulanensis]|uniref:head-tail connector protein n=1 Tax=Enterococcus hulanensis TaxID=2559929 RepID=UPI00288D51A0|nr:head-tail connector protein [Enterococcus hulanensis]MDT2660698.1 head-tail connector protein [Enterococcus hulanensis]